MNSIYSDNTLWIYDENMEMLKNLKLISGSINMDIIMGDTNNRARWITVYSVDNENGTGLIQGPYKISDQFLE